MITKKYNEIIKAAKVGGAITKKYFGEILALEGKTMPADFRTKADVESEAAIIKIISKAFPSYNIISEEAGEINKNSEFTFHIDPLDGTNNFVLGIPNFSTSIGLLKGEELIFGAVYNPFLNNLYYAEKGKGSFHNEKKVNVNNQISLNNSTVSVITSYDLDFPYYHKINANLYNGKNAKRVLNNWSVCVDFCLLATGKIEGIVALDISSIYDFAAGKLIAKEAGAKVTDLDGNPEKSDINSSFLITNGTKIHGEILEI